MATENNNATLQDYELMVIFTPVLAEDEYKAAQQKFAAMITDAGGKIMHSNPWGMRSLAYPIDKKTTGLYWVLEYQASTDLNTRLEVQMNRDESIMRHMITRLDKYAVQYNEKRRNRKQPAEASSEEAAA